MNDFKIIEDEAYRKIFHNGYQQIAKEDSIAPATEPLLSLIVPIYNEEEHLPQFLELLDVLDVGIKKELVFVDDKSKDNSLSVIQNFPFKSKVIIKEQNLNQGKGAAIQKGLELANGTIIGVQDADFEYRMSDISMLLKPLVNDECDVVYGSRYKKNAAQVHRTYHYLINRLLTTLSNLLSGLYLTDMETCYKFFKADVIKNIEITSNRFGFEPEVTAKIARLKVRIFEFPISYHPRNYEEGKKITWKDGIAAFFHITRFNLFSKKESDYRLTLPKKYIPTSKQLL